jgi:hypothetical protein
MVHIINLLSVNTTRYIVILQLLAVCLAIPQDLVCLADVLMESTSTTPLDMTSMMAGLDGMAGLMDYTVIRRLDKLALFCSISTMRVVIGSA